MRNVSRSRLPVPDCASDNILWHGRVCGCAGGLIAACAVYVMARQVIDLMARTIAAPFWQSRHQTNEVKMYAIKRFYFDSNARGHGRTIESGLTLEEAQAHCKDLETSSSTCTSASALRRTRERGAWFDGYVET